MVKPLTDHEYRVNGGAWTPLTTSNATDNGDGTYTINGLDENIPFANLEVRVAAVWPSGPSDPLLSNAPFTLT